MIQELSFSDDYKALIGFGDANFPPMVFRLDVPYSSIYIRRGHKGWLLEQGTDFESSDQQISTLHGAKLRWKDHMLTGEGMMVTEELKPAVWTKFKYDFQQVSMVLKWVPGPFALQIFCVSGAPELKTRDRKSEVVPPS